ncbi:MAG: hypothetical protein ACR2PM_17550, partial [Hyphomicrobiales bacterium]
MRQFAIRLVVFAITIAVMLGVAEGVLRLVPSLIDVAVLERFAPSLRSQIARRVGLPVRADRLCIPSGERHDRGPDLCINRPNVKYPVRADPKDLARGAVEILPLDGKGFCNLPGHAARAKADIVMLGDSFTWCTAVGAEAAFTTLVEASLQAPAYNLGVAGIGPYEYLELLRRFGLPLGPKVVVMNIYEGNDLRDVLKYVKHRAKPGKSKIRGDSGPFAVSYALAFLKGAIEVT